MVMLTNLKVSTLACQCVFYRSEQMQKGRPHELNVKGLDMQKCKTTTGRAQRAG